MSAGPALPPEFPARRATACPRCGTAFACGAGTAADGTGCWCMDAPRLPSPTYETDCLCLDCLKREVAARQQDAISP